jgi:Tol biopolymer transport system component
VYRACVGDNPGEATQISSFSDGATAVDNIANPRLSPDGTKILFQYANAITGIDEIWVVNAAPGSSATALVTSATASAFHPDWGPDSDTFVYVQATGAVLPTNGVIYKDTVSAPGSPTTLRTPAANFSCYRPMFNYDGSKIAYWYQHTSTSDELRVMNADGTGDATVDTAVGNYDNNNPQTFGWARAANKLCYAAGTPAYVINSDGTGKTQLNTAGAASGAGMEVTHDCWAPDDSFVVVTSNLGNGFMDLIRCEVNGSNTTRLNTSHGAISQSWMRGAYIYNGRIWFIESANSVSGGMLSSTLLDGTDYRQDLDVLDAAVLWDIGGGSGFVWN